MTLKLGHLALASALLLSTAAIAQEAPPGYGAPITLDTAKKIIAAAEAEAKKNNFSMVITVLDTGANAVAMERMDGTQLGSIDVAAAKAATAVKFKRATKVMQDAVAAGGEGLRFLSMPVITVEGGELLISGGKIIGSIGVSGGSSAQDGQIARVGVAALGK